MTVILLCVCMCMYYTIYSGDWYTWRDNVMKNAKQAVIR